MKSLLLIICIFASGCKTIRSTTSTKKHIGTGVESYENVEFELPADAELKDLIKKALSENGGVKAAFYNWKSALARVYGAGTLSDPKFSFGYFIEEVETRVGPQKYKVSLSQTFPWFGTLDLQKDQATLAAKAAQEQFYNKRNITILEVRRAYAELFFINHSINYIDENIKLLQQIIKVTEDRVTTATTGIADLLRLEVELDLQIDRKSRLNNLKTALEKKLISLIQCEKLPKLKATVQLSLDFPKKLKIDELEENLFANNPSLKSLDYLLKRSEIAIELSRKNKIPDVTIGVDYIGTDDASMPGVHDSGKDPIMLMISVNIPIWQSRYNSLIESRIADKKLMEMSIQDKKNMLKALLSDFVAQYKYSDRTLRILTDNVISKQRKLVEILETDYINNKTQYLDMIQSIRKLLVFELQIREAEVKRFKAMAGILNLTGN